MARLKSRTQHIPYDFRFLQPEAGQTQEFVGSFNRVCEMVLMLRQANPFLCERFGWRTDLPGIEADVEAYNVARCIANGWTQWLEADDPTSAAPTWTPPPSQKKTRVAVVANVKRVAAGVALLVDWLGSGGKPVDHDLAEKRAAVCYRCPKNNGGDWKAYFTEPIAEKIRTQLEMKHDMKLETVLDDKLTICSACDCPLPLKVHTPLSHILDHTSEDVKGNLDPACWILSEAKAL